VGVIVTQNAYEHHIDGQLHALRVRSRGALGEWSPDVTYGPPEWALDAACAGRVDPDDLVLNTLLGQPGQRTQLYKMAQCAKDYCARCPVTIDCERHGARHGDAGLYGGRIRRVPVDTAASLALYRRRLGEACDPDDGQNARRIETDEMMALVDAKPGVPRPHRRVAMPEDESIPLAQ
jgi:hypothetical protein